MSCVFSADRSTCVYTPDGQKPIKYRRVDGTYYHQSTPDAVVRALEWSRVHRLRIRLSYGNTDDRSKPMWRDWMEENDVEGYVGRSSGELTIPLLVANSRSSGGGAILDHCIVRLLRLPGRMVIYQHPSYSRPEMTVVQIKPGDMCGSEDLFDMGYRWGVDFDGKRNANFKTGPQAQRYVQKMS